MITDNLFVAKQISDHIDRIVSDLKNKVANPVPQDQYKDLVGLWSTVGEIRALNKLKAELIDTKEE